MLCVQSMLSEYLKSLMPAFYLRLNDMPSLVHKLQKLFQQITILTSDNITVHWNDTSLPSQFAVLMQSSYLQYYLCINMIGEEFRCLPAMKRPGQSQPTDRRRTLPDPKCMQLTIILQSWPRFLLQHHNTPFCHPWRSCTPISVSLEIVAGKVKFQDFTGWWIGLQRRYSFSLGLETVPSEQQSPLSKSYRDGW